MNYEGKNALARILAGALATLGTAAIPLVALAQEPPKNFCEILKIVNIVGFWFGIVVFIIAVVAILYSAFLFLTAGGAEDKVKMARTILVYGLIGIAVALLSIQADNIVAATTGGTKFTVEGCLPLVPIPGSTGGTQQTP